MREGRAEQRIGRWIGAAAAVMRMLHQFIVVKRGEHQSEAADLQVDLHPHSHYSSTLEGAS